MILPPIEFSFPDQLPLLVDRIIAHVRRPVNLFIGVFRTVLSCFIRLWHDNQTLADSISRRVLRNGFHTQHDRGQARPADFLLCSPLDGRQSVSWPASCGPWVTAKLPCRLWRRPAGSSCAVSFPGTPDGGRNHGHCLSLSVHHEHMPSPW